MFSAISPEQMKQPEFWHVDRSSHKLKEFFGWAWSKNACGESGHGTLKFIVSQE